MVTTKAVIGAVTGSLTAPRALRRSRSSPIASRALVHGLGPPSGVHP
ncbi:hypothetical protein ACWEP4_32770 [Streptomyces sp. NPDC004227]